MLTTNLKVMHSLRDVYNYKLHTYMYINIVQTRLWDFKLLSTIFQLTHLTDGRLGNPSRVFRPQFNISNSSSVLKSSVSPSIFGNWVASICRSFSCQIKTDYRLNIDIVTISNLTSPGFFSPKACAITLSMFDHQVNQPHFYNLRHK